MSNVTDINSERGEKQRKSESKNVLNSHNNRKAKKRMEINSVPCEYDYGKNNHECVKHVDELARDKGNRKDFARKIDFLDQIAVNEHTVGAGRYARTDENPRNQGNEQEEIVFFNLLAHKDGKDECINDELQKRV